ncbi:MAG: hypothetical protein IEMM0008_1474 [bacterium]|nr:MAG: hypothetical protein IEMM0008_1474 [bacterium]
MTYKAILIRIGVDQAFGNWNAPCNPETGDFVYAPIPQDRENIRGLEKYYVDTITPALKIFSVKNNTKIHLPSNLKNKRMHLDPDFEHLSYGDTNNRGRRLLDFDEGDVVVFYSGLRSINGEIELVYALTGILVVQSIERVKNVLPQDFDSNAHTRNIKNVDTDIIVRGKPKFSGRFRKYIPIGEFRNRSYRVKTDILDEWGNIGVKDGWIQRSVNLPLFLDPEKFMEWLLNQSPELIASNN